MVENSRLFALVNLAMADAGIAAWGCKPRPISVLEAHRRDSPGRRCGNPFTPADPNWQPLGASPIP